MLRLPVFALAALLSAASWSQDTWLKAKVSVPDSATLERLQSSDLTLMDCVPHIGSADVAVGPGDTARLIAGGYQFKFVGRMENPYEWAKRHTHANIQVDDYRLHYFNADQILAFFEDLRANNPVYVTRQSIGTSIDGETMWAYRFGRPLQQGNLPFNNVVVEGLIHAREWITGSVIMHLAKQCVLGLTTPQATQFLPNQAVWVIPMVNPDGYRYTWTNNRLWRKNRRNNGGGQFGVDLNRNFSKGYGLNGGSSGNPGSETYRGTAAFSEPESTAVRNFVQGLQRVGGFIDWHSYSQLILWPWGYTTSAPPDATLYNQIGNTMRTAMNGFGTTYTQGQTANILYIASGTSNDWAYDARSCPGMAIELRDTGQFGFELPENQIFVTQDEAWAGFKKFMTFVSS
jgi:murein tripeptide amidase MpaA